VTYPDSTVAIIGTGTIGSTLAAEFAAGGQDFRQLAPQRKSPKSGDSRSP
jgi:predicted dinucleotide-binding enzyme